LGLSLARKLLGSHLVSGDLAPGSELSIRVDHTLIQDSTGTMADLQFEAIGVPRVRTELSVSFADHNMLQDDYKNMDDHRYLQSVAAKYGLVFSKAGNGICHQVYLERFAKPGKTLLGSDSHTPTAGAVGMLAIGVGGMDVAAAMAGAPFTLKAPKIVAVELTGRLKPFVSAKDVVLEVLRRLGTKGGVNKILEYTGPGVATLSVPERGTITNMGTETGATTSLFPSDAEAKRWMEYQGRAGDWTLLTADPDAEYDEKITINLSEVESLAALPHSPGNVKPVREVAGIKVDQVCVGSCTNSSLRDLKVVAALLRGKHVKPDVSLTVSPGSRQVLIGLAESGDIAALLAAGARVLECACGPCIGMGQAPSSGAVSLRTFNRNFEGRSGTQDAQVYLVSPETAAAAALTGVITDPRSLGDYPEIKLPASIRVEDSLLLQPSKNPDSVKIIRGPNIAPLPEFTPLPPVLSGEVLLKLGDDVTTDDILPAGAQILPLRSNIPEISKHTFTRVSAGFHDRAKARGGGFVVGGENYGQGSSREHAALAPRYLGVKAVIAKSFARIHASNLVNFGILPLTFTDKGDYAKVSEGDRLKLDASNLGSLTLIDEATGARIKLSHSLTPAELDVLKAGGKLPHIRKSLGA
jgi:aconitate hydratase